MPEYGSVKKVMPKSRDLGNGEGISNSYSSRPIDNYQSITIDQGYPDQNGAANAYGLPPQQHSNAEMQREMARKQQEIDFINEERNFAR